MDQKIDKLFIKRLLIIALLALAVIYIKQILGLTVTVWGAVYPLFLGCIIAFILNIVLRNLEKFYFPHSKKTAVLKSRRPVCILLSFLIILGIDVYKRQILKPVSIGKHSDQIPQKCCFAASRR